MRGPDDLEGWAQLCPECLGKAGTNPFLRGRLRNALEARGMRRAVHEAPPPGNQPPSDQVPGDQLPGSPGERPASQASPVPPPRTVVPSPRPAPGAAPAFPDDWYLRRGPFEHGAIHDAAWNAELDMVTRWVDAQPLGGRILEPAAGTGFFSPLLAERGELHASDPDGAALDLARSRLVAHRLLAHLHVRDPWARPAPDEPRADALLAAFLLGRVRGAGLDTAAQLLRDRLRGGGRLAVVDLRPDAAGGPPPGVPWTYHAPELLEAALVRGGFAEVELRTTGRFFLVVSATAA